MSPSLRAVLATALLLGLTAGTALLTGGHASPWLLALNATLKAAVIGWVFLELNRAWPGWALGLALGFGAVAFGAVALMG